MDRLIIGDVGYGKTEIAIKIFKTIENGYQCAILAPTDFSKSNIMKNT